MQTQFDIAKMYRFCSAREIQPGIEQMDFPWMIGYAFDAKNDNALNPDVLSSLFSQICQRGAERTKPEVLKERLIRHLKDSKKWPNGFLGNENLPFEAIGQGRAWTDTVIGMTGVHLRMRRYGTCLGIQVFDAGGKPHEETESILGELSEDSNYLRHFVHSYIFSIQLRYKDRKEGYAFNFDEEHAVMQACLPDITWAKEWDMVATLVDDFVRGIHSGVEVGSYGDAKIFLRLGSGQRENVQKTDDKIWRQGLIHSHSKKEIVFREGNHDHVRLEYFIRTTDENNMFEEPLAGIDYWTEQWLLQDLARILYNSLYQRMYQSVIDHGNGHVVRFRERAVKAAAA